MELPTLSRSTEKEAGITLWGRVLNTVQSTLLTEILGG